MKILVTGGAGFIGAHLTRQLLKNNFEVEVLDNLSTGNKKNLPQEINLTVMDIRDVEVKNFIKRGNFDAIVHLAAQIAVADSMKNPQLDADINIAGTINILEAARLSNVRRIIFASTAAVYGDVAEEDLPIKESHNLRPMSFYALSKMTAENYIRSYAEIFGLEYVILRFANVYGEYQIDRGEGGVISIFTRLIKQRQTPIIFGDGLQTRDFIHADDIAAGICAALTTKEKNSTYNLSTQTEINLNDLIKIFGEVAGYEIFPQYQSPRQGDISRSSLANEKAKKALNWQPKISLSEGLKQTYLH